MERISMKRMQIKLKNSRKIGETTPEKLGELLFRKLNMAHLGRPPAPRRPANRRCCIAALQGRWRCLGPRDGVAEPNLGFDAITKTKR